MYPHHNSHHQKNQIIHC